MQPFQAPCTPTPPTMEGCRSVSLLLRDESPHQPASPQSKEIANCAVCAVQGQVPKGNLQGQVPTPVGTCPWGVWIPGIPGYLAALLNVDSLLRHAAASCGVLRHQGGPLGRSYLFVCGFGLGTLWPLRPRSPGSMLQDPHPQLLTKVVLRHAAAGGVY
mmetsp:Transcript_18115/g.32205  ORF Transcript_18115/g.32205 Transcript_18115/m.32205 type:complete len:159 (+) Transcript_18115:510-986(+)